MVKIYLIKEGKRSGEFIEISFWSIIKANVLSTLTILGFIFGISLVLSIIFDFFLI